MPKNDSFTFYKYHGCGNDFILVDNRKQWFACTQRQIEQMCDRHFGIGADGLILLEHSERANFKMVYFNADGMLGSFCGNGGRCIVSFAAELGIISHETVFEAFDGLHRAHILSGRGEGKAISLEIKDVTDWVLDNDSLLVDTGSPHYIRMVHDLNQVDVVAEGRRFRYDQQISVDGVNVNFFEWRNEVIHLRTYERGVESETLSCGTGVVAAAIAALLWKKGGSEFRVLSPGGELRVRLNRQAGRITNIVLTGPAEYIFTGHYNAEDRYGLRPKHAQ